LAGHVSGLALLFFAPRLVHQIGGVLEAREFALVNGDDAQGGDKVSFAGPGAAYQDQVMRRLP